MTVPIEVRKARRTFIDGKWVAAHVPPEKHGDPNVYDYHYCRCLECAAAKRARRRGITADGKQYVPRDRKAPEPLEHFVHEYQHFIGFGRGHQWTCEQLDLDPEGTRTRLERNGYGHLIPTR